MRVSVTDSCDMCSRVLILDEEEMQWLVSGQPLASLVAEAYSRTHVGFSSLTGSVNTDAVASMNSAMDDLESLFGFAKTETYESLSEHDVHNPSMFYSDKKNVYIDLTSGRSPVRFCPFCGRQFADIHDDT